MKKCMIKLVLLLTGACFGGYLCYRLSAVSVKNQSDDLVKNQLYFDTLNQWLSLSHCGHSLEDYFKERGYQNIAIYGLGELGQRFLEEMINSSINVKYTIDQNIDCMFAEHNLSMLEKHNFSDVDVIVVTPVYLAEEIAACLEKKVVCPVISLAEVIDAV